MKKVTSLLLLCAIAFTARSQSVGIGTITPNASAQLDITATDKGLLIPRMNTAAINSIGNPAKGLMVLDTATNQLMFNTGTPDAPAWQSIAFNNGWGTTGNAGTHAASNFIGTTDDEDLVFKRNNEQVGLLNNENIAWGAGAFSSNTTGTVNIAIGKQSLRSNTEGTGNIAVGYSQRLNAAGSHNVSMGNSSLFFNENGNDNTAIGSGALFSGTGSGNTAIGYVAGLYNTGNGNVFIGDSAGIAELGSNKLYIANSSAGPGNALLYGEFDNKLLRTNGDMEIRSDNTTSAGLSVIKNYSAGTNSNIKAIYGENLSADGYGIGIEGKGGLIGLRGVVGSDSNRVSNKIGVRGVSSANNTVTDNIAVDGWASGSTGINTGVSGYAYGKGKQKTGVIGIAADSGEVNVGVYGIAFGGTRNLAGVFEGTLSATRIGIGNDLPHGSLQFSNTLANRKIVLYEGADNDNQYNGFGTNTNIVRYQAAAVTSSHIFYAGTSPTSSTELMRIAGSGEVGIGKIPGTGGYDGRLQVKQKNAQSGISIEAFSTNNYWDLHVTSGDAGNLQLATNGFVVGAFDGTGAYTVLSDRRVKKDINLQQPVLDNIMQLQAYRYHYIINQSTDRFSNGFMAQDVQKIFPDAVVENEMKDGEKRLGINYQYFTVLAIKGLQEQQQQIQTLEQRIAALEALVRK